jgi:hypothetical protein
MWTMLLAIPFHYSLIFMYLFVRLALYHKFNSFGVVRRLTQIGLENATWRNSQNSPAKG